jgi:hypothetical protein
MDVSSSGKRAMVRTFDSTRSLVRRAVRRTGIQVTRLSPNSGFDERDLRTARDVAPFTLTSPHRVLALCAATRYVARSRIPGAFVECGVWRGGSMLAAALTLVQEGDLDRELYLYDTYEGMTDPTDADLDLRGRSADETMGRFGTDESGASLWCNASIEDVGATMARSGYATARVHLVKGPVEETIPGVAPTDIAMLRLDTDWYESTRHEMEHLFPRIVPGGVLIIDDYGHWQGARRAVDEYLEKCGVPILLNRVDYTGRIAVVPGTVTSAG